MIAIQTPLSLIVASIVLVLQSIGDVRAEETTGRHVLWQKVPIAIHLGVGKERLAHFRGPVSVGVPATLGQQLRTQTVNGTVYWLATAPFRRSRIAVRELDTGQMYLFDIKASTSGGDNAPLTVIPDQVLGTVGGLNVQSNTVQHDYVSLTRFAAQHLYAPTRLLSGLPGVVRVPLQQQRVALVPGGAIEALPLVSWRSGSLYVTALRLVNRSSKAQILDPRTLRGNWLSAAFQHARLLPGGDLADTTAVYLVSAQAFDASGLD